MFLALGLAQDGYRSDVRGLDDGRQEVLSCFMVWIIDARWSGHVSPSGANQRVIWRSGVYSGTDTQ